MKTLRIVVGVLAPCALFAGSALGTFGCGATTCSTSDDCSDSEYCPLEEGACLLPTRPEMSCAERPTDCPDVFAPVCGCDGTTYANACLAAVKGVSVALVGACEASCAECGVDEFCSSEAGACGQGTSCLPRPATCPPVEDPVCGCDGNDYPSACEAQRAGQTVFANGTCEAPVEEVECGGPAQTTCPDGFFCEIALGTCGDLAPLGACRIVPEECADVDDPVCGCDGQTYRSSCEAAVAGVSVQAEGGCPCGPGLDECDGGAFCDFPVGTCLDAQAVGTCAVVPESCSSVVAPVCGCDGQTYGNACLAAQASVAVGAEGACPCGLGLTACGEGSFCSFPLGVCADAEPRGVCAAIPTECPTVATPVCGCDGVTYDSPCAAAVAGVSVAAEGGCPCGPGAATCPDGSFCQLDLGTCSDPSPVGVCISVPDACSGPVVPVCGCNGVTYDSPCAAAAAEVSVAAEGACACGPGLEECDDGAFCNLPLGTCADADARGVCNTRPTECPPVFAPVCGCDGVTYESTCHAAIAGAPVAAEGGCPCSPDVATCPVGSFCQLEPGACGDAQPVGACVSIPATCPDVDLPVCGCDGQDYGNACEAAQAGLSVRAAGVCP